MTLNEQKLKDEKTVTIKQNEKTEDRIYPEDKIEEGSNPDHHVKDEVNPENDDLLDSGNEEFDPEENHEVAQYPDEAGVSAG